MRAQALFSVLSKKLKDQEIIFVDELKLADRKTKLMAAILGNFSKKNESVLIIPVSANKAVFTAGRNIEHVGIADASSLNVYECLAYKRILIERGALETIQK